MLNARRSDSSASVPTTLVTCAHEAHHQNIETNSLADQVRPFGVSPWIWNLSIWSPTPQSGQFALCVVFEARTGSCKLRLFCVHFDPALLTNPCSVSVDVEQVLLGIL